MTARAVDPGITPAYPSWERLIRSACSTVANEPEWLIEAILVVQHFGMLTPAESDDLLRLADRIATEYGVVARPEPDGASIALWFGRPQEPQEPRKPIRLHYVMPSERRAEEKAEADHE